MKQSTRLLSVLLTLAMLCGILAVGVNADTIGLTKSAVAYDSIDNAALTPQQVATLALDYVDNEVLAGGDTIDLSVAGELRLDSINHLLSDLYDVETGFWFTVAQGLLGDIGDFNFDAIENGSNAYQRSNGDLTVIYQLLKLLSDNKSIVSKIVYGVGTDNGIDLGVVNNYVSLDLDVAGIIYGGIFDNLLLRSYSYPSEDDVEYYTSTPSTIYEEWDDLDSKPFTNVDTMLNTAVANLLTTPQDKVSTYNSETGLVERTWDMDSIILPTVDTSLVNINNYSILQIIDNIIQLAYNELGVAPLNHDLKKVLMEATGVDFVRVKSPSSALVAACEAITGNVNYFVDATTFYYDGSWYFRDYVTQDVDNDNDGEVDLDAEGNEITEQVYRYFKADTSDANPFYDIINWDYAFTANDYDFAANLTTYGSIVGQINHILYFILDKGLTTDAKNAVASFLNDGQAWYIDGDNSNISTNLLRIAKYVLCNFTEKIFGKDSEYLDAEGNATTAFVTDIKACTSVENLVAYLVIPMFNDIMPELIMPANFDSGLQIEEIAALALRELLSSYTPALNFDSDIFVSGTLTSSTGRVLLTKTQAEWQDTILDMALNLAAVYLDNTTNFNVDTDARTAIYNAHGWQGLLEEIVDWAVDYVGDTTTSVIVGLEPSTLNSVRSIDSNGDYVDNYAGNAFTILSTALNKLLPFGFICGSSVDSNGVLNVETLFWTVYDAIADLDVPAVLGLLGRNSNANNILSSNNVVTEILVVLNKILGAVFNDTTILQSTANLNTAVSLSNLKTTVSDLLAALYTRRVALLTNLLPVVGQFVSDWGGEQEIASPGATISRTYSGSSGSLSSTSYTITNASKGVWRQYTTDGTTYSQDEQYAYQIIGTTASVVGGTATVSVSANGATTKLAYGQTATVTFSASSIAATGAVVKFTTTYKVYDEDGNFLADGASFTRNDYVFISYNATNSGTRTKACSKGSVEVDMYGPYYVADNAGADTIPGLATYRFIGDGSFDYSCKVGTVSPSGAQSGITLNTQAKTTVAADAKDDYCNFTVNEATYDAAVAAGTITSGTVLVWQATGTAYGAFGLSSSGTKPVTLKFYSGEYYSKVKDLAGDEADKARIQDDYNTTTCYADKILVTAAAATEDEPQETNFTTTGLNDDNVEVTLIDGATAWTNYITAFVNAYRVAFQPWNDNSLYTHEACYNALRIAKADLEICKKNAEQIAASGGANNDTAVEALITQYDTVTSSVTGYKDYMLYRWDRYEDWQNDAKNLIKVYDAAKADIDTTYFPYTGIDVDDLATLLSSDAYEDYILALCEDLTTEQIEVATEAKADAEVKYASEYSALEISQISNMLDRTSDRLLAREGGVVKTYLQNEYNSALAVYGNAATSTIYTAKSWDKYLDCLADALDQINNGVANDEIFDAKYDLQKAENALIPIADGADYSGLEDAIVTAQAVLDNISSYDQGQDKGIGELIAALGYEKTNGDGDVINLFPGAALDVVEKPYTLDDQDRIDDAEYNLRLAIANVRYSSSAVTANTDAEVETRTDEGNDSYFAIVPANLAIGNLYDYLNVTPSGDVSNLTHQLVTIDATFAGTGTVVTYYGTVGSITLPVASYTVIVRGDITGDSAIDAADAMIADLALNEHTEIEDTASFKAALADSADEAAGSITINSVNAILNAAVGG